MNNKDHLHPDRDNKIILDSWKEISSYLERSEKTCRKWEKKFGLPVYRMENSPRARVFAYKNELENWMSEKLRDMELDESDRFQSSLKRLTSFKSLTLFILAVVVISLLFLLLKPDFFKKQGSSLQKSAEQKIIAVLPLVNINGNREIECFADGMTDALITELAKIRQLKVISRTSVMAYKNGKKLLKEIGNELNADCVVEGIIYCDGSDMRISVQLIDSKEDIHLWAENYREQYRNIFGIQKKIALDIAEHIAVNITSEEIGAIRDSGQINMKAYENFLRGTIEFDKTTRESLYTAIDFFNKAINIDPEFARGYAWMGISHFILAQMDTIPPRDNFKKAKEYADIAISIDKNCAEAIAVQAIVKWGYDWDIKDSENLFLKAISLSPSSAITYNLYRYLLFSMGRMKETSDVMKLICELDPNSRWNKVLKLWASGDDVSVKIERLEKLSEKYPGDWRVAGVLAGLYFTTDQFDKSINMDKRGVEINNNHYEPVLWLARNYNETGDRDMSLKLLKEVLERDETEYVSPSQVAEVYCSLKDFDKAFEYLERAYDEKDYRLLHNLLLWPHFENLRSDPRYDILLKKMGMQNIKL